LEESKRTAPVNADARHTITHHAVHKQNKRKQLSKASAKILKNIGVKSRKPHHNKLVSEFGTSSKPTLNHALKNVKGTSRPTQNKSFKNTKNTSRLTQNKSFKNIKITSKPTNAILLKNIKKTSRPTQSKSFKNFKFTSKPTNAILLKSIKNTLRPSKSILIKNIKNTSKPNSRKPFNDANITSKPSVKQALLHTGNSPKVVVHTKMGKSNTSQLHHKNAGKLSKASQSKLLKNINNTSTPQAVAMPPNYKPLLPPTISVYNHDRKPHNNHHHGLATSFTTNTSSLKVTKHNRMDGKIKLKKKVQRKHKKNKSSRKKPKKSSIKNERAKQRRVGGCHDYLGCVESWFEKYRVRITPSLNTVSKLKAVFTDIFKKEFVSIASSQIKSFVEKLSEQRLINWAIIYDYRPQFASWMNIEFLRMPLAIETPANLKEAIIFKRIAVVKETQDGLKEKLQILRNSLPFKRSTVDIPVQINKLQQKYDFFGQTLRDLRSNATIVQRYQNEAPALAVSGFDRSSYVWSRCAPKEMTDKTNDLFVDMYQSMMDGNSYQCALFAFMKCVRDMENDESLESYIIRDKNQHGSFERYEEGFRSLIRLHYDYGAKQNNLLPIPPKTSFKFERLTSAYCESSVKVQCLQEDGVTKEDSLEFEQSFYCQNYFGCYITCGDKCFLRERNLLPDEKDRLITWLSRDKNSTKAETELWSECCSNVQNCIPLKPVRKV